MPLWLLLLLAAVASAAVGAAIALVGDRSPRPSAPANPFDVDDDEALAAWSRGPRHGVPACRYCGGLTMHDGPVCYACAHTTETR